MGMVLSGAMASLPWTRPVQKAQKPDPEIERLLGGMERSIKQAFLDAIEKLAGEVDTDQIVALLRQGLVGEAINVVNAKLLADGLTPIALATTNAVMAAGQVAAVAASALPDLKGIRIGFDMVNPHTATHLRSYAMDQVRGLTSEALASVKAAVADGVAGGRGPADIARDVRAAIGLTEQQTKAVGNFRRMLENRDKEALTRQLRDKRFDGTVRRAVEEGKALKPDQIDKMVERYQARMLKMRAETISRTEALRALNTGNHLTWLQAVSDGKVSADQIVRRWVVTLDGREREAHRLIPSMNPDGVGLDEPFKSIDGPLLYPGDPSAPARATVNCRCTVLYRIKTSPSG